MNRYKIIFSAFVLMAMAQLYVPAKMIFDKAEVWNSGVEYKFKTAPIDPNDPFRGKYITLQYAENEIGINNEADWVSGETIYVEFEKDINGFAKIKTVLRDKPKDIQAYLKTKVNYVSSNKANVMSVEYPFDRFYMEESKAYEAELTFNQSQRDSSKTTYALVSIKNGDAVLKDVLINEVSIKELIKAKRHQSE